MPKINNKQAIFVSEDERPSRFLLDLNKFSAKQDAAESENDRAKSTVMLADVSAVKVKKNKQSSADNKKNSFQQKQKDLNVKLQLLTFFPLLVVIFKIIRLLIKMCYGIGWVVVLLLKIPWLLLKLIFWPGQKQKQQQNKTISTKEEIDYRIFNNKIPQEKWNESVKRRMKKVDWSKPIRPFFGLLKSLLKLCQSLEFKKIELSDQLQPAAEKKFWKFRFKWLPLADKRMRTALYLAAIMIVLILPFKLFDFYSNLDQLRGKILGISEAAMNDAKTGEQLAADKDFSGAGVNFAKASDSFATAELEAKEVSDLLSLIAPVIPNQDIKMAAQADLILAAGKLSAKVGADLSLALGGLVTGQSTDTKALFDNFNFYCQELNKDVASLNQTVQQIHSADLPEQYRDKFSLLQDKIGTIVASAHELSDLATFLKIFLGVDYDKRYLLVFQNNAEMRASGGFLGSYALVDFSQGKIKHLEVPGGGSYDTEGGMIKKVIAPEPLSIVNPRWFFWDANWWPDWPTTARKLEWFYEQSEGRTTDGVISLTPTAMEKILTVIGPIDMQDKYKLTFTADNFWELTESLAEQKPFATTTATSTPIKHEPKKIIGDLLGKIMEELPQRLNRQMFIGLLQALDDSINEKHILVYVNDPELESTVADYGADGQMKNTDWDYLMVVNTNIAGGKSDREIKEEINHSATIQPDGSIVDTLIIKRTHNGQKRVGFGGVRNNDWLRVYVPLGSELITASGFSKPDDIYFSKPDTDWLTDPEVAATEGRAVISNESGTKIYEENGKTVFANWSQVDPGESATLYFKYRLPFLAHPSGQQTVGLLEYVKNYLNPNQQDLIPYALLAQKQPGSLSSAWHSQLLLPDNYNSIWSYGATTTGTASGWNIADNLSTDKYYAALLTIK